MKKIGFPLSEQKDRSGFDLSFLLSWSRRDIFWSRKMNKLYLGAAYYPELWEEEEIEKDIARIKEAGLNCVRMAEFAWGRMEPKEGEFHFKWLKNVVEKLYKNGIYTVLCTPFSPLKYLFIMPIVLFKRFPKSLHKSKLNLSTNPSGVNVPS